MTIGVLPHDLYLFLVQGTFRSSCRVHTSVTTQFRSVVLLAWSSSAFVHLRRLWDGQHPDMRAVVCAADQAESIRCRLLDL